MTHAAQKRVAAAVYVLLVLPLLSPPATFLLPSSSQQHNQWVPVADCNAQLRFLRNSKPPALRIKISVAKPHTATYPHASAHHLAQPGCSALSCILSSQTEMQVSRPARDPPTRPCSCRDSAPPAVSPLLPPPPLLLLQNSLLLLHHQHFSRARLSKTITGSCVRTR